MTWTKAANRRAFMTSAWASAALLASLPPEVPQAPEVRTFLADVPPGATLWGFMIFTADEPIELTIRSGSSTQAFRGEFDGRRLAEYSLRNPGQKTERAAIRAKALAGDREIPSTRSQYVSEQTLFIGFGRRGTPLKVADRRGGYPFEAVFVGFIVFEAA